jgi:hypothetical protein
MFPLPKSFERGDLKEAGLVGWRTWNELLGTTVADVPAAPAVYVVIRPSTTEPLSLRAHPGGRFKHRDPMVAPEKLAAKCVRSLTGEDRKLRLRFWPGSGNRRSGVRISPGALQRPAIEVVLLGWISTRLARSMM